MRTAMLGVVLAAFVWSPVALAQGQSDPPPASSVDPPAGDANAPEGGEEATSPQPTPGEAPPAPNQPTSADTPTESNVSATPNTESATSNETPGSDTTATAEPSTTPPSAPVQTSAAKWEPDYSWTRIPRRFVRISATVHGFRAPKSADDKVMGFPWSFGLGVQVHQNFFVGVDEISYGRVDVPSGRRQGLSLGPALEYDYYPQEDDPTHFYLAGVLAGQQRWGGDLDGRTGVAGVAKTGLRLASCSLDHCFALHLELQGLAAFSDYMVTPVVLPSGALAGMFGLGGAIYF